MREPFDLRTDRQRAVILVGFLTYLLVLGLQFVTDVRSLVALEDLVIAAIAIPAGAVVLRRALSSADRDVLAVLAGAAFVVAGLATGYAGVAVLAELPSRAVVEGIGSLALLAGVLVYFYYAWS